MVGAFGRQMNFRMNHLARSALRVALDVVFPRSCVLCGSDEGDEPLFCPSCRKLLDHEMARPACPRCGHSIGPYGLQDRRCHTCRHSRPPLDALVRISPYGDATASIVRAFKYGGRDELDIFLADLLADVIGLADWYESVDAMVYVPTHWRHAFGRKFYAARVLAEATSRAAGIPLVRLLRRTQGGPHQFDVPRTQRLANIRGKFAILRGVRVNGARVCLIDDVSTTGATLNECARTLKKAGAAAVYGAVIAKVNTDFESSERV